MKKKLEKEGISAKKDKRIKKQSSKSPRKSEKKQQKKTLNFKEKMKELSQKQKEELALFGSRASISGAESIEIE